MRDIIDMAREAGGYAGFTSPPTDWDAGDYVFSPAQLKAFEALVRADERAVRSMRWDEYIAKAIEAEREACAKFFDLNDTNLFWGSQAAKYIRARGETK